MHGNIRQWKVRILPVQHEESLQEAIALSTHSLHQPLLELISRKAPPRILEVGAGRQLLCGKPFVSRMLPE